MDDKITGLSAAGLPTRDIRAHLEEIYGLCVSADLISRVTNAVLEEVSDWQNRALEPMYPIVFLYALRVKIRDTESRQIKNKAVNVALGVTPEGDRAASGTVESAALRALRRGEGRGPSSRLFTAPAGRLALQAVSQALARKGGRGARRSRHLFEKQSLSVA